MVEAVESESSNATAGYIKEEQSQAQAQTQAQVPAQPEKNAYEILRIKNIKRNNARLRSLGLISIFEENRSNALAEGKDLHADVEESSEQEDDESSDGEWNNGEDAVSSGVRLKKKKRKRKLEKPKPREGSRKSKRLQGVGVDNETLSKLPQDREFIMKERLERVKECREVRLRAAKAVAECGAEKAAKENPTATYEHCLHRIRSMTHKGLANRVSSVQNKKKILQMQALFVSAD